MMRFCLFSIAGFIILSVVLVGCGGNDWDTIVIGGPAGGAGAKDGRVVLDNKTPWRIEVKYFLKENEVKPGNPFGERTYIVQPGETKTFDELIVGGTRVFLSLRHIISIGGNPNTNQRELVINGNVGFRARNAGSGAAAYDPI